MSNQQFQVGDRAKDCRGVMGTITAGPEPDGCYFWRGDDGCIWRDTPNTFTLIAPTPTPTPAQNRLKGFAAILEAEIDAHSYGSALPAPKCAYDGSEVLATLDVYLGTSAEAEVRKQARSVLMRRREYPRCHVHDSPVGIRVNAVTSHAVGGKRYMASLFCRPCHGGAK